MCVLVESLGNEMFWLAKDDFWRDVPYLQEKLKAMTSVGYMFWENPEYRLGREIGNRLSALGGLVLLMWFLVSGSMLRARNGQDSIKSMIGGRRLGRWGLRILLLFVFYWLDVIIGVMLQHW